MTPVDSIRAAKEKMEQAIRLATSEAIAEFEASTGLTPESIYVQMVRCDTFGRAPVHLAHKVDARVVL